MTLRPLFLYGTLRDPDILLAVLGRAVAERQLILATAPDCAAVYFPDRLYPALVQRSGGAAPGLLLPHPTLEDFAALDAFEGGEYRRGAIQVATSAGMVGAEVYWPAVHVAPSALDWTLERWTGEHKQHVLPRETDLAQAARWGTGRR